MDILRFKTLPTVVLLMATVAILSAQPEWTVNSASYEFSMTVSGIAIIECIESLDENDMVASFIDGEVHGVQKFDTESEGHAFAFLLVYDNLVTGNSVTFKVYDASEDRIIDAKEIITFTDNDKFGTFDQPFIFSNEGALKNITISPDTIPDLIAEGSQVAELTTFNDSMQAAIATFSFIDDDQGPDNHLFTIDGSELIIMENVDQQVKSEYQIHVHASVQDTCSIDQVIIMRAGEQVSVGINSQNEKEKPFQLFPNPAQDYISIRGNIQQGVLRLIDMNGKTLIRENIDAPGSDIPLEQFRPGFYIVLIQSNDQIWSEKIEIIR